MSTLRLREKQTIHLSHNSFGMIIRLRQFIFIKRMYQMNTPAIVGSRRGREHMVIEFTTIYAISAYHH